MSDISLQSIKQDIIDNYRAMLNGEEKVSAYRYLLYKNVYNGKYKGRLLDSLGYADEYRSALTFLTLINRLALTHSELFDKYINAYEANEDHVGVLLNIFADINHNSFVDLNNEINHKISELQRIILLECEAEQDLLNKFIKKIIHYNPISSEYDYFEVLTYMDELLGTAYFPLKANLQIRHLIKIQRLREELSVLKANLVADLKLLKKDINHYLLSINEQKRIQNTKSKSTGKNVFISPYTVIQNFKQQEEKKRISAIKSQNKKLAHCIGINVGIGEGAVASVAMFSFLAATGIGFPLAVTLSLVTIVAGFICNYYLVRNDTYIMLNKFRLQEPEAQQLTLIQDLKIILESGSLATGFVYAALSAMQLYHGLLNPLLSLFGFNPLFASILGTALALPPVFFTALGFASIFYFVIDDFIDNKRWQGIKIYFHKNYIHLGWKNADFQLGLQLFAHTLWRAFTLCLGIGINVIVTVASFGIFHTEGVQLLKIISNSSFINVFATVLTAINEVISTIFNVKNVNDYLEQFSFKDVLLIACKAPYYVTRFAYLLVSNSLDLLLKLPLVFSKLLVFGVTSLINLPGYVIQILLGILHSVVNQSLQIPKYLVSGLIGICLLMQGTLQLLRAFLSLALRILEWCVTLASGIHVSCFHNKVNTYSTKINIALNKLIDLLCKINQQLVYECLTSQVSRMQNSITNLRHQLNATVYKYAETLFCTALGLHQFLTQKDLCKRFFEYCCGWFTVKNKSHEQDVSTQVNNENIIQRSVAAFGKKTALLAKFSVVVNGLGQSALISTSAKPLSQALHCSQQNLCPLIAVSQFVDSSAPNDLAINKSFQDDFKITYASCKNNNVEEELISAEKIPLLFT